MTIGPSQRGATFLDGLGQEEPHYTTVDTWALAQHDCEILDEPRVLLEIDDDCILFHCCPALPLEEIAVDFARPAVLIWDRVVAEPKLGW
ncbi:hypothetical protein PENFLA_c018G04044 [Penicillium flavigenum]|uniref:Uncharacterized protein n=1 Tax=Penicillium flavigenum TaxID=254877 RepID=A0A1V6T1V6_9EURO|nr:hypothetical protein PENFLA_c018G04044 [Penicillium flavigenum]